MAKCDCYFQHGMKFLCYGTKEMEECSCGGDKSKCNFYPEKREQKPKVKKQFVDVSVAKTFIEANWPNDPLLKQIAFNLLDKLPRVEPEWIPVTERLPAFETERVLVMTKGDVMLGYPKMDTDRYVRNRWVRYEGSVTHWMPIPDPPDEDWLS